MPQYTSPMTFSLIDLPLPVRLRTEKPLTDEELLNFSSGNDPLRVEREANGELIVMSPTGTEGGSMETDIASELWVWAREDGRGRALGSNTGFRLSDSSVRAADAAWISWPRWNSLPPVEREGFAQICPEFIIELRSKTDRLPDVQAKMQMWIANGVELAWLIDPERKVIEIYRPGEATEIHQNPTSIQGTGPIRGFELVLQRIWG